MLIARSYEVPRSGSTHPLSLVRGGEGRGEGRSVSEHCFASDRQICHPEVLRGIPGRAQLRVPRSLGVPRDDKLFFLPLVCASTCRLRMAKWTSVCEVNRLTFRPSP